MHLLLQRDPGEADYTPGLLFVDGQRLCYTLEDQFQAVKVRGETRITAGIFEVKLRNSGGMAPKYARRFPWHRGMLWLQEVPNFEYVYIHIGNKDDDTLGCILVGMARDGATLGRSLEAYAALYHLIIAAMDRDEKVWIEIRDSVSEIRKAA